jgi:hypothetical protein
VGLLLEEQAEASGLERPQDGRTTGDAEPAAFIVAAEDEFAGCLEPPGDAADDGFGSHPRPKFSHPRCPGR